MRKPGDSNVSGQRYPRRQGGCRASHRTRLYNGGRRKLLLPRGSLSRGSGGRAQRRKGDTIVSPRLLARLPTRLRRRRERSDFECRTARTTVSIVDTRSSCWARPPRSSFLRSCRWFIILAELG